jgi:hypothetical protein
MQPSQKGTKRQETVKEMERSDLVSEVREQRKQQNEWRGVACMRVERNQGKLCKTGVLLLLGVCAVVTAVQRYTRPFVDV